MLCNTIYENNPWSNTTVLQLPFPFWILIFQLYFFRKGEDSHKSIDGIIDLLKTFTGNSSLDVNNLKKHLLEVSNNTKYPALISKQKRNCHLFVDNFKEYNVFLLKLVYLKFHKKMLAPIITKSLLECRGGRVV